MISLSLKNITKKFDGIIAVDDVTFDIPVGKVVGIIGSNGSGKSTLINVLSGICDFDAGNFFVGRQKLSKIIKPDSLPSIGIARTFQDAKLFEQMTVIDNLLVVLVSRRIVRSIFSINREKEILIAEELLKKFKLYGKRNKLVKDLSYGQRKLLEIIRVLAINDSSTFNNEINIFLFDEPFAGLFPEAVGQVISIVNELRAQNKIVVIVEHNIKVLKKICDWFIVMDGGKIISQGKPSSVLSTKIIKEIYLGN